MVPNWVSTADLEEVPLSQAPIPEEAEAVKAAAAEVQQFSREAQAVEDAAAQAAKRAPFEGFRGS